MSDIDRSGAVRIVLGGAVVEVPYRRAVGLVATGRATWWKEDTVAETPKKAPGKPVKAPVPPVLPEQAHIPGETLPPLPDEAYAPDAVPLPPVKKKPGKPDVSTPAHGVEGDEAGNEPPPIDP